MAQINFLFMILNQRFRKPKSLLFRAILKNTLVEKNKSRLFRVLKNMLGKKNATFGG